jgi:hypothetical protein
MHDKTYCTREGCAGGRTCDHGYKRNGDSCPFEYDPLLLAEKHRWKGEKWPPPPRWTSDDGTTIIYRSYADAID